MQTYDSDFQEAVSIVAKYLLQKWDVVNKFTSLQDALNFSIYLGGGETFSAQIGDYCSFEYDKGCKITLIKKTSLIEVDVPKKYFMSHAKLEWDNRKNNTKQLLLF